MVGLVGLCDLVVVDCGECCDDGECECYVGE